MAAWTAMSVVPAMGQEAEPNEVVATAPAGRTEAFLMDLQTYDESVGYAGDYHEEVRITFCENGDVYLPNMVYRRTLRGWLKGRLNAAGDTLTLANRQAVGYAPNLQRNYRLCVADRKGRPVPADHFRLALDEATRAWRFVGDSLYLALYLGTDDTRFYGIGAHPCYTPKDSVEQWLETYDLTYRNVAAEEETTVRIKGYRCDDDFFFKGLDPKYPSAWLKATAEGDDRLRFASRQVVWLSNTDTPYLAMAAEEKSEGGTVYHADFVLTYDAATETFGGLTDGTKMLVNAMVNDDNALEVYQRYDRLRLVRRPLTPCTPEAPAFYGFTNAAEPEFVFVLSDKGTDGTPLDPDGIRYRFYIDDRLYTFTKAAYPGLKSDTDLTEVPFAFYDYNYVNGRTHKKYIYFRGLPAETATIGVEQLYTVKGDRRVSARLVYDVKTQAATVVGLGVRPQAAADVRYFDLTGRAATAAARGVLLRVTTFADGTRRREKVLR